MTLVGDSIFLFGGRYNKIFRSRFQRSGSGTGDFSDRFRWFRIVFGSMHERLSFEVLQNENQFWWSGWTNVREERAECIGPVPQLMQHVEPHHASIASAKHPQIGHLAQDRV